MTRLSVSELCIAATVLAASLFADRGARAQQVPAPPRVEIAATYSASRSNVTDGSSFWAQGGGVDAGVALRHRFSLAANMNGSHSSQAATSQAPFSLLTFTAGPRYTWAFTHPAKRRGAVELFGQGLFGVAHEFDSTLPAANSASSFALQLGAGMNVGITPSFAIRAIEADWVRTQLPNATTGVQNSLRLTAGFVYRF